MIEVYARVRLEDALLSYRDILCREFAKWARDNVDKPIEEAHMTIPWQKLEALNTLLGLEKENPS